MKKSVFSILFTLSLLFSQNPLTAQSGGIEVLGNWTNPSLPPHSFGVYNEVWGITVNGHEYGIVGSVRGTHFIDLESDPLQEVFFVAGRDSIGNNIHRDYHNYGNYLYAVCDEGSSSLQVMDFSDLPNSVSLVYDSNEFFVRSHNIFIDEDNKRLYTTETFDWYLSLENPEKPVKVNFETTDPTPPRQHDLYVRDNIAYLNCEDNGLWVYDVNDPQDIKLLGNMTSYPNQGYNHSGWLNDEGTHYYLCEETTGADIKAIDVTDFSDLEIKKRFNVGTPHANLPHNAMITGDYLYISYYYDGLQVYDISNPEEPFRVAFYDTFIGANSGFKGNWGVYSKLPSGRILASDMTYGLFLLGVTPGNYPIDATLESSERSKAYCTNLDRVEFDIDIGPGFDAGGVTLDIQNLPSGVTVDYSMNPALPGSTVTLGLSGITDLGMIRVTAEDGIDQSFYLDLTIFSFENLPNATPLEEPTNEEMNVGTSPTFTWLGTPFETFEFELGTDPSDIVGTLIYSEVLVGKRSLELPIELFSGTYYWRVSTQNECGTTFSEVNSFSTNTVSTVGIDAEKIILHPNPASDHLILTLPATQAATKCSLMDVQGKTLQESILPAESSEHYLELQNDPGVYFLRLENEGKISTKKLVIIR